MLVSLALIFLLGLLAGTLCNRLKLPRIIGMLIIGIVLGPFVLNALDIKILTISTELRQIALIIILLKAGLSLNLEDLKQVGRPAILMAFLPACFEIIGYVLFAPLLFPITRLEAALMGAVLSAVSPAIVVPRMVRLIEEGKGKEKSIPQLILAGASCDDVFVIVLFSTFLSMAQGDSVNLLSFLSIPLSIITGVVIGLIFGLILSYCFEKQFEKGKKIRNSIKVIIILGLSFLLMGMEDVIESYFPFSALLAVVTLACTIKIKSDKKVISRLSAKMGKLWLAAEVILFVLVGASVDIRYTFRAGFVAIGMIAIALLFRTIGVVLSLIKTNLNFKERLFCVFAYLPKATVQAAIGSIPLSLGLECGNLILSIAVLGILITAPLGAFLIDKTEQKLLESNT